MFGYSKNDKGNQIVVLPSITPIASASDRKFASVAKVKSRLQIDVGMSRPEVKKVTDS